VRLLPDTSIWVDYLRTGRGGPAGELDDLLAEDSVFICGPVAAELLAGAAPDRRDDLWIALGGLPWADLDHEAFRDVGHVANDLRRRGDAIPLTDVMIAVVAARSELSLWTRDRDFERIRSVLPALELRET
jgi:predicted nucleic acid-binding protein